MSRDAALLRLYKTAAPAGGEMNVLPALEQTQEKFLDAQDPLKPIPVSHKGRMQTMDTIINTAPLFQYGLITLGALHPSATPTMYTVLRNLQGAAKRTKEVTKILREQERKARASEGVYDTPELAKKAAELSPGWSPSRPRKRSVPAPPGETGSVVSEMLRNEQSVGAGAPPRPYTSIEQQSATPGLGNKGKPPEKMTSGMRLI
jgi:hypothetical protein